MALEVCSRAYVFEVGRIAFDGPRGELIEDPRIKKAYLAGSSASRHFISDCRLVILDFRIHALPRSADRNPLTVS